jgi:hypothetical protein
MIWRICCTIDFGISFYYKAAIKFAIVSIESDIPEVITYI